MYLVCLVFIVFLFVVLTPSNFVRLPQKGNKWIVSLVHGIIFAIILCFTYRYVMSLGSNVEGYKFNGLQGSLKNYIKNIRRNTV